MFVKLIAGPEGPYVWHEVADLAGPANPAPSKGPMGLTAIWEVEDAEAADNLAKALTRRRRRRRQKLPAPQQPRRPRTDFKVAVDRLEDAAKNCGQTGTDQFEGVLNRLRSIQDDL